MGNFTFIYDLFWFLLYFYNIILIKYYIEKGKSRYIMTLNEVKKECKEKMDKVIDSLNSEFAGIRSGRANPKLLDKIMVEAYGQSMPLNQVATISVPEARLIVVEPWDKSLLGNVEKAIHKSDLGINPINDGKIIRLAIPPLTEERRKEYVKQAKSIAEDRKTAIRNIRREVNDKIKKEEKSSNISEDESKRFQDEVQTITDSYIEKIDNVTDAKEKEIMEI
jgi:ribosome recycling factor